MGPHTLTMLASGGLLLVLLAVLVAWPTPYVVWSSGGRTDALTGPGGTPGITVRGVDTYPVEGTLVVSSVAQHRPRLGVAQLLADYVLGTSDVFPDAVMLSPVGGAPASPSATNQLSVWQRNTVVAALQAAGLPSTQAPIVSSVVVGGPAYAILRVNDIVNAVDGQPVKTVDDVREAIAAHLPTDTITFDVTRGDITLAGLEVTAQAANDNKLTAVVGASFTNSFTYNPVDVRFNLAPQANNPSSSLMVAIGLYDMLSPSDVLAGRSIGGVGEVDTSGAVSVDPVSGIREQVTSAASAGATIFLVPNSACPIATAYGGSMALIRVATLADAIDALGQLAQDPSSPDVPHC